MRHLLLAGLLLLGACVETVKFSPVAPSRASAEAAMTAERALTHPQSVAMRGDHASMNDRLSFCTATGLVEARAVRVTDDGVCGLEMSPTWPGHPAGDRPEPVERCWRYDEMTTIGRPRDGTTVGYYAVRGYLSCEARS